MSTAKGKKVFVGMSGGVDSSVAALLLKRKGYAVTGVFVKGANVDGCAERDAEDARRTAEKIGIPFYVFDFEKEYGEKVVEYMLDGYRAGKTPNPDVMCNREIKFGLFARRAFSLGADFVATGHYVRLKRGLLAAAADANKDQSYFLWTLTREDLRRCLFPLGGIAKPEVRRVAKKAGLPTAEKKDSQGVCFLGMFDVKEFLAARIKPEKGAVLSLGGETVGAHDGAALYTIGQRHGFTVDKKGSAAGAHYVVAKDAAANTITVAEGADHPALFKNAVRLSGANFPGAVKDGDRVLARVRYRQPLAPATLGKEGGEWVLAFDKPQKFVAPGQSAVVYVKDGTLVGGGIIV